MGKKPKRHNLPPPGRCIFCDRGGLTKEHLFADWLRGDFPRTSHDSHVYATVNFGQGRALTARRRHGHSGSRQIRRVCRKCNNVWIGRLDDDAKAILPPIYKDIANVIRREEQEVIAAWLTKISMVGDSIDRTKSVVPRHQCAWLLAARTPPIGFQVWLGSLDDPEFGELGIYQRTGKLDIPAPVCGPDRLFGYIKTTTIGIGRMLALVIGADIPWVKFNPHGFAPFLRQIWPIEQDIDWPTSPIIRASTVDEIADIVEVLKFVPTGMRLE